MGRGARRVPGTKTPWNLAVPGGWMPCAHERDGGRMAGRRVCAVQAFRRRQNLGGGGIHFRRAFQISTDTIKKATPDGCGLFYGGDYWTRTSDLLRVKMRRDVKALILGAFRHFWPRFLWVQATALSTVSTR